MPAIHAMTEMTCSALIHSYIAFRLAFSRAWNVPTTSVFRSTFRQRGRQTYPHSPLPYTNNFRILGLSLSSGELDSHKSIPPFPVIVHIAQQFWRRIRLCEYGHWLQSLA